MSKSRSTVWRMGALASPLLGCSGGQPCPPDPLVLWDGGVGAQMVAVYTEDGGLTRQACQQICPSPATQSCYIVDAGLLVSCQTPCIGGRLPMGGIQLSALNGLAGSWMARMAELEAAAVGAFEHLAKELEAHGYPQVAECALAAAIDEVRHATEAGRVALRLGHCPAARPVVRTDVRSLDEIAIDNAGEGCGRELLGAMVNRHQATHALDSNVRTTMAGIAIDEEAHGQFSMALADLLMPRLTIAQRRRVREAQEQTVTSMLREELPNAAARILGLMDERQLRAAAEGLLTSRRV